MKREHHSPNRSVYLGKFGLDAFVYLVYFASPSSRPCPSQSLCGIALLYLVLRILIIDMISMTLIFADLDDLDVPF